jgi:hypothetical protein
MKYLTLFAATIITFFSPIIGMILTLLCFILADTIVGIYCTIRLHGIKSFRSTKLFNSVVKTFFYIGTVMTMYAVDIFVLGGALLGMKHALSKIFCVFFMYIEFKSIDETSMKLGNRSAWVIFKELINKLQKIKKDIKDIESN